MRVLVVDDEHLATMVIGHALSDKGYDVRIANSFTAGLELSRSFSPDLLLVDYLLSDKGTGVDVAGECWRARPDTKVLVMTGMPVDDVRRALAGIDNARLIGKPIEIDELVSIVEEMAVEHNGP